MAYVHVCLPAYMCQIDLAFVSSSYNCRKKVIWHEGQSRKPTDSIIWGHESTNAPTCHDMNLLSRKPSFLEVGSRLIIFGGLFHQ